jgi:hypothetical protein
MATRGNRERVYVAVLISAQAAFVWAFIRLLFLFSSLVTVRLV